MVYGFNDSGQLGLGDNLDRNTFTEVTTGSEKILQIACGDSHSVVVTEQGIYTTGLNNHGQSGYYSTTKSNTNTFTAVALTMQRATGYLQQLLDTNGSLFTWGF